MKHIKYIAFKYLNGQVGNMHTFTQNIGYTHKMNEDQESLKKGIMSDIQEELHKRKI